MGDLSRLLNADGRDIAASPIAPDGLAEMIGLIADGTINGKIAKALIEEMYISDAKPAAIVDAKGWRTLKDTGALVAIVDKVFADNSDVVTAIKEKALTQKRGFLVGQIMKASQGKADPQEVNALIDERLNS